MTKEPLPRASEARAPARRSDARVPGPPTGPGRASASPVRYLVILAVGAFALPAIARLLEALGAPRAPEGASAALLGLVVAVAVLAERLGDAAAPAPPEPAASEAEAPLERP